MTQLIRACYKKLTTSQQEWHTFESDLYAMVVCCNKIGSYITIATVNYPPGKVNKIAFWGDSAIALGQWSELSLHTTVEDHLSAKSRRFYGWADKAAYTRYWPMSTKYLPGDDRDIGHTMSHLGDAARARSECMNDMGTEAFAYPATVYAFHGAAVAIDPIAPYAVVQLGLSAADASEMESACLKGEPTVKGVRMCDVYRVVTDHAT